MAEINEFIGKGVESQIQKYIDSLSKISGEYIKINNAAKSYNDNLQKQKTDISTVDEATKQYNSLLGQLNSTKAKITVSESNLNREIAKAKLELQNKNKALKESLIAENSLDKELKVVITTQKQAEEQSKRLAIIRKNLNVNSKDYEKNLKSINAQIDKNTLLTKSQADADKKRTLGIGEYERAISGLPGPLGGVVSGMRAMTTAALTFIATPIGAVIAAIGLAIGALTNYFKSSEEGQNAFNKVAKIGSVILGNLSDIISDIGKAIFEAFANPQEAITGLWELIKSQIVNRLQGLVMQFKAVGRILKGVFDLDFDEVKEGAKDFGVAMVQSVTGVEDAIGKTKKALSGLIDETEREIATAKKLADIEAARDLKQRKLIVDQEKLREKSRELRLQAEQSEGEQRIKLLEQAFAVEDELARRRTEIATINLNLKRETNKLSKSNKDDLDEEARLEAELYVIQQERLKLQRTLQAQINTEKNKQVEKDRKELEASVNFEISENQRLFDELEAIEDAEIQAQVERDIAQFEQKAKMDEASKIQGEQNLSNVAKLSGQETALTKARALKQAIIDGKAAVQSAFAQTPGPLPIKIAAAAIAGFIALKNVKDIMSTDTAIPAYADGVESTPSGKWIAGERGRELKIDKSGRVSLIDKPTLFTNEIGSKIISNPDTERILRNDKKTMSQNFDDSRIIKAIERNSQSVSIDKFGIITISSKNSGRTKYLTEKYRN